MGEIVCSKCGLVVLEGMLDMSPEWRAFTPEEKRSRIRVGPPTDYSHFDKGLSTIIWIGRDAQGRPLSAKTRRRMWRLRNWHIRSEMQASESRNLLRAMSELQRLSEKLNIPSFIRKTAAVIYRKALNAHLIRGRCIAAIIAAALYASCRFANTPKTLKEIAEASARDKNEISRDYSLLIRELGIRMPIPDPLDHISRIANKAGICGKTQRLAVKILREAKHKHLIAGKHPVGVAAAVLYIACQLEGEKFTQKDVAAAANITEVTIRNRKRELVEELNIPKREMWL